MNNGNPGGERRRTLLVINQIQFGYHTPWYYFSKYLAGSFDVTYLCWDFGQERIDPGAVRVVYVPRPGNKTIRLARFVRAAIREMRSTAYDVKVVRYFRGCSLLRLTRASSRAVYDIRSGSVLPGARARQWEDFLIRIESRAYRNITVLSEALIPHLRLDAARCRVVPLGGEPLDLPAKNFDAVRLLYVGTLFQREIHRTVEGFARFVHSGAGGRPASYDIVGTGPERDLNLLRECIRRSGVSDRVRHHGRIPYMQLAPLFDRCTAGVAFVPVTNYYRSQPATKVYEYLLAGMTVVATATPENGRLVSEANGVLCDDTPEGFCEALQRLAEKLPRLDSKQIRERAAPYSWRNIVETNLKPFLETVARQP
jgi:hypothetical protein